MTRPEGHGLAIGDLSELGGRRAGTPARPNRDGSMLPVPESQPISNRLPLKLGALRKRCLNAILTGPNFYS